MESGGGSGVVVLAMIDLCSVCGMRAKVNCVRYKTCKKWVHARCARITRVSCKMNQIKSITSVIIVALTSGVFRQLSIMNFECNVM